MAGQAEQVGRFVADDVTVAQAAVTTPVVPVSWGELYDKISILEIKEERLTSDRQLANVRKELGVLRRYRHPDAGEDLADLLADLREINTLLWDLEDDIREKEREKDFSEDFITLARSVYQQNDRRAGIKRRINRLLSSDLTEEKSYKAY